MTRRWLLAACPVLPVVRAFDLVRVVIWVDGRLAVVRWEPRAIAEEPCGSYSLR